MSPAARKDGSSTDSNSIFPPGSGRPSGSRSVPETGWVGGNSRVPHPVAARQTSAAGNRTARVRGRKKGTEGIATDLTGEGKRFGCPGRGGKPAAAGAGFPRGCHAPVGLEV